MKLTAFLKLIREAPLIASAQASVGSPLESPETIRQLAEASLACGSKIVRVQGLDNIRAVRAATNAVVIGLIKRPSEGSEVFITPAMAEVDALIASGCEVIALDATARRRPDGSRLVDLIAKIHAAGRLAMADCDGLESIRHANEAGADLFGTTLSGYTPDSVRTDGPDFSLLRQALEHASGPVIAEGRYEEPWQASAALRIGASAVVVGGALNDPVKQTKRFARAMQPFQGRVGAVDIGGTWLRFASFSDDRLIEHHERIKLPEEREVRIEWIRKMAARWQIDRLGVGTGGVVDPREFVVVAAKPIIPNHVGTLLTSETLGLPTIALNDGLATAWGHACHPKFAGRNVATLALGTGVGFGWVSHHQLHMSESGEPPHLNDCPSGLGGTYEELLGGAALSRHPTEAQKLNAMSAASSALSTIRNLFFPELVVVCGGVGLAPWLDIQCVRSPFGQDAGLIGAASLAWFPPSGIEPR